MPEIGMSVSMSGDGKRGVGHRPQATAPILDSTDSDEVIDLRRVRSLGYCGQEMLTVSFVDPDPQWSAPGQAGKE
jgi:hypothetical protein